MELTIDLKKLEKSGLFLEDFCILALINLGIDPNDYNLSDKYVIKDLEENMYIRTTDEGYELRGRGRELFESKASVTFEEFWNHYHTVTHLAKTDRAAAEKYWKRLKPKEKELAVKKVQAYYNSLNDKKFCRKARTYLENKNFNDEFKVKEIKDWTAQRV